MLADPAQIAPVLASHWREVFTEKGVDKELLQAWLADYMNDLPMLHANRFKHRRCPLRRHHLLAAISASNNSAPGPDGIPFAAWRRIKSLAATVLTAALHELVSEGGAGNMVDILPDFNAALLHFLPKKVGGHTSDGTPWVDVDAVRPLSVTNADNRILANAVRYLIEPLVAPGITDAQRGFLPHRSLLSNVLDIDEGMMHAALEGEEAAAIFFDLAAAFPSIEQELMHQLFAALNWPRWLLNFVRILYSNNDCEIVLAGARFSGFRVTRGSDKVALYPRSCSSSSPTSFFAGCRR